MKNKGPAPHRSELISSFEAGSERAHVPFGPNLAFPMFPTIHSYFILEIMNSKGENYWAARRRTNWRSAPESTVGVCRGKDVIPKPHSRSGSETELQQKCDSALSSALHDELRARREAWVHARNVVERKTRVLQSLHRKLVELAHRKGDVPAGEGGKREAAKQDPTSRSLKEVLQNARTGAGLW